jgi:hypothetical protein
MTIRGIARDPFDEAVHEHIAKLERLVSTLTRDLTTVLIALAKCEGGDPRATAYRHLGRHLEDPWMP